MHNIKNKKWIYPESIEEAKKAQEEMAQSLVLEDCVPSKIRYIAGLDVSNNPYDPTKMVFSAVVTLTYQDLSVVETVSHKEKQEFPYIPGLLGFREAPVLIHAFEKCTVRPDLLIVDGHGISHPRGLGIASHIGVLLDIPTIGVAKSILVGTPAYTLSEEVGSTAPLVWKKKEIGILVRSKKRCLPLIISQGHKISLERAIEIVMYCIKKYRLPEPTRHAHLAANACRVSKSFN